MNKETLEEKIIKSSTAEIVELVRKLAISKNAAYTERNQLVGFISKIYPSHLAKHPASDTKWESDWRTIVCIHSPKGQLTWHIHDSERKYFFHLKEQPDHWDGHTTEEKYKRLKRIKRK